MAAPTFKFATDPAAGSSAVYGAPDIAYALHVVDGSHATDRIPIAAIEGTAVALSGTQTISGTKTFNNQALQVNNPAATFQYIFNGSAITVNRNVTLPLLVGDDTFVMAAFTQTLTNKTMSGSQNTFSAIPSASIVTLLVSHTLDTTNTIVDSSDNTKVLQFSLSGATTAKTATFTLAHTNARTYTFPDASITVSGINLAETITAAKTFTTGLLKVADISDANGVKSIVNTATASAVNWIVVTNAATGNDASISVGGESNRSLKLLPSGTGVIYGNREVWTYNLTDETTLPTTDVKYTSEPLPYNVSIDDVIGGLTTAGTGATLFSFDILYEDTAPNTNTFTTIFSTKPTIDASEFTTTTAATPYALSVTSLAKGRRVQYKINALDSNSLARGAKISLLVHATAV